VRTGKEAVRELKGRPGLAEVDDDGRNHDAAAGLRDRGDGGQPTQPEGDKSATSSRQGTSILEAANPNLLTLLRQLAGRHENGC
jgi:hypothetical protein